MYKRFSDSMISQFLWCPTKILVYLLIFDNLSRSSRRLSFNTAYHPKIDGQSERTIQTLEDMLKDCVLDFSGSWDRYLPLVEFTYNNSYHSSIEMILYEAHYGRPYRFPTCQSEVRNKHLLEADLIHDIMDKITIICKNLITTQSRQKSYAYN